MFIHSFYNANTILLKNKGNYKMRYPFEIISIKFDRGLDIFHPQKRRYYLAWRHRSQADGDSPSIPCASRRRLATASPLYDNITNQNFLGEDKTSVGVVLSAKSVPLGYLNIKNDDQCAIFEKCHERIQNLAVSNQFLCLVNFDMLMCYQNAVMVCVISRK